MDDTMPDQPAPFVGDSQKALTLILALDQIRDTSPDPGAMLTAIVSLVGEEFKAGLCLLALVDRDSGELELKAINDRANLLKKIGTAAMQKLAQETVRQDSIQIRDGDKSLAKAGMKDSHMAIIPIIMTDQSRLGVMIVVREKETFSDSEKEMFGIVESQVDSAVVQGYAYYELQFRTREIETIYHIDKIRDQHLPFDEMLGKVLHELRSVIQAEMGFIMLYHRQAEQLEMRASTHDDLFHTEDYYRAIDRVSHEALEKARLIYEEKVSQEIDSIMAVPLILRDEILGVFGVVNRYGSQGFDENDRRMLTAIASQMDTAIFEGLEQRRLRQVLGRSVDPAVMEKLLANPEAALLGGERAVISVLYADIRGSTALAERVTPDLLVGFINDYLGTMADVIMTHEGTLDKFVGDEVMALFGAPHPRPDHARQAIKVGLLMQEAHKRVMDRWQDKGIDRSPIGIGIATGELIVGEMGSENRTNYTVIGRVANLGARICSIADEGQVLISEMTYDMVKDQVDAEELSGISLKGIGNVRVYRVKKLK
jgi:class 3 adenylate cyclase